MKDAWSEASDPATPGERLRELWRQDSPASVLHERALELNPALPLDLLREALLQGVGNAWHNPAVPLLLLRDPLPEYRLAARQQLARIITADRGDGSLEAMIARAHRRSVGGPPLDPIEAQARALARRLASVFSLPWPEP